MDEQKPPVEENGAQEPTTNPEPEVSSEAQTTPEAPAPEVEEKVVLLTEATEQAEPETVSEPEAVAEPVAEATEPEAVAEPVAEATEPEAVAEPVVEATEPEAVAEPVVEATQPEAVAEPVVEATQPEAAVEPETTTEQFAEMFEADGAPPERMPQIGEKVSATVVRLGDDWVFVSYGGKAEGSIQRGEFLAEGEEESGEKKPLPTEGDTVEAYVLSRNDGETVLTTRLTRRDQSRAALEDAYAAGVPVEGRVAKAIKGGFEVRISGLRGFCPLSQMDLRWPKDPESHVGQIYSFKIIEYKEKGRNIIVSRRALLEEERITRRDELKKKIVVGELVTGTVRNVQSFGAFVELDGVDGLIPVSEMAWSRVNDPKEIINVGDEVTAKVISADWEKERISLSLKALQADPWMATAEKYKEGEKVTGTVARLADFGAFVSLEPGLDGMIHISALGSDTRVKHPRDVLEVGQEVEAEVVNVDIKKRRIGLSLEYKLLEGLGDAPRPREVLTGEVEKVMDFGVLLKLPSGHVGLIPNAEMNTRREADHKAMFKPGDEMEVKVLEVTERGRKIRLSVKALVRDRDREARKEYEAYQKEGESSMGTFADLFKGKLVKE